MRIAFLAFLILFIPTIIFAQPARRFISFDGIGELRICDDTQSLHWRYMRDSSSQGRGFEFFGKFLRNLNGSVVLTQLSLIDSTSVIQLSTTSTDFETYEGIKVGTPLAYVVSKFPDIQFTVIRSKHPEIYFSLQKSSRRLKFKVDSNLEREFAHLNIKENQRASDVPGLTDTLKKLGKRAVVEEITVLLTGICK